MTEHQLGIRDGFIHALLGLFAIRQSLTGPADAYLPPRRHVRKRAAAEAKLETIDQCIASIKAKLATMGDGAP